MTIINTSPDRPIQLGYEGEDRVTVLRFRYGADWLENGEGIFTVRILRNGENQAYNAQLIKDDRENCIIDMTVTDVELSKNGYCEMQLVYTGANFVKKSPVYKYYVSRSVDEAVDPPAQDVYTQIIESLSDLQTDYQGLANIMSRIDSDMGSLNNLTTTAKTDLVSAINEVNEHGGGGSVTVDSELSTTSRNPVQNKVITARINGLDSDVGTLRTSVQSKADTQTVSALADEVNGLDEDVQGLQTDMQSKADKTTATASSDGLMSSADKTKLDGLGNSGVSDVQVNGTSVVSNGVAEIPVATDETEGVVKVGTSGTYGIKKWSSTHSLLTINSATSDFIKNPSNYGTSNMRPITPNRQHESTFYGLAKAAGDTTQATSSNAVGQYTEEAKTAIRTMLGLQEMYEWYKNQT